MGDSLDFIQKFHNLEGDVTNVRKENFFKLLKTPSLFQNEEQLNITLKNLKPKTYQEHVFYIETLLYFKRIDILLDLLKSGNELYTSKILKPLWFFEVAFKDIESEKLVNEFLPYLSYSIRKKILSKLLKCWKTERIDSLFDALDKKYGLTVAIPVLQNCTPAKIKSILNDNEVHLRPNQVLELLNNSEECFKIYLDHINGITHNIYDESKVLNHLARINPELYLELEKDKKIRFHQLSKKTTKKFVPLIKEDLLTNSEHYFRFLNRPVAIRKLGCDFEIIYKKVFPNRFNGISAYSTGNRWLEYYPKSRRWNLFIENCNNRFSDKTLDQILLQFSAQIKKLNPPKEVYFKWAEINYQKQEGNFQDYLQYYKPDVCIPIIKEKINVTKEIYQRGNLIHLMIKSCSEHKDFTALEQVLQYICFRHRNEDANFRNNILREICNNFKLEDLNENHWKYINEQIKILKIQKEFQFFVSAHILERHLEYLFKNKKDHKEALFEYIDEMVKQNKSNVLDLKNKPIEKEIYTEIGKKFKEAVNNKSEQFITYQTNVISAILNFSVNNPEYSINLAEFPDFLSFIKQNFAQTERFLPNQKSLISKVVSYNLTSPQYAVPIGDSEILNIISLITTHDKSFACFCNVYKKFLLKKNRSQLENSMLLLYFDKLFEPYPDAFIVNWFIKNEPLTIVPYFDKIVRNTISTYNPLDYKLVRNYSHLNFDRKVCSYYKIKLDDNEIHDKKILIVALSILLSTEDFQRLIEEKYLPQKDKLDLQDTVMVDIYNLQCIIIKHSAKVVETYKMLPTIMKFCRGDYLQSALRALYKAFYRSPERVLYSYVEALSKMAVSVRKHAIFLSCEVLDKGHTLDILKRTTEGNISGQKHLFSAILKYFLKNPSRDLLQKLIESMSTIDKNDLETLNTLSNVTIPLKYRSQYLENCWKFFEGLESKGVKIKVNLEQLLYKMRGDIAISLTTIFVSGIMNKYCFKEGSDSLNGTDDFAVEILKTRVSEGTKYFTLVFDILSKSKITVTSKFFNCFIIELEKSDTNQDVVNLFFDYWNKYFTMVDYLNEHIKLNLRFMRLSNSANDKYAIAVINYLDKLMAEFGFHVYNNFKQVFQNIVDEFLPFEYYSLLLAILKYKLDETTCILVLDVLTLRDNNEAETLIYLNIKDILKNVEIPIVCAYRNNYLRDNNL